MLRLPSLVVGSLALLVASASGCGLRSDPFAPDYVNDEGGSAGNDDSNDPGDPNRAGTCNNPIMMPFVPMTHTGSLSGPSFGEGWCGSDGGPEDVYSLTPEYDVDVLLRLNAPSTDFTPTLRVIEDGCDVNTGVTKICTRNFEESPFHFLALAGHTYSIIIDSATGAEGDYSFEVDFGDVPIDQCSVHPEVIEQIPGSAFLWNNDFTQGQGRVDSYCGGPGRENMFLLFANSPGTMVATVETSGGFAPLVSLRTGCAALSELACETAPAGQATQLTYFLPEAGEYYLVVDQAEIGAGGYQLRVDFQ